MVEESVSDPTRIAELLASELTGLATPPLHRVSVVDADDDATPSADGTVAYGLALDGERVGSVLLYPDRVVLELEGMATTDPDDDRLTVEAVGTDTHVSLGSGVAVKRAVDVVRDTLDAASGSAGTE
jgi:hypothetical protein